MHSPLIISKQPPSEKGQGYILCFHYTVNPVHPMQSYADLILCEFQEQTLHKSPTLPQQCEVVKAVIAFGYK